MLIYSNTQMYMSMQGPLMGHGTSFYIYSVYIVCVYVYQQHLLQHHRSLFPTQLVQRDPDIRVRHNLQGVFSYLIY